MMLLRHLRFALIICAVALVFACTKNEWPRVPVGNGSECIYVLGDIQYYTVSNENMQYYKRTLDWIHKYSGTKICCVMQTGDVSEQNKPGQWKNFFDATVEFGRNHIFVACTGNHDYDWDDEQHIQDRKTTKLSQYALFDKLKENIVAWYEYGSLENVVVRNAVRGRRLDIISLEFGPRTEVLDWALNYVVSNPDTDFILLTHEWLSTEGKRISSNAYSTAQLRNTTTSTPQQIWEKLVYKNDNIRCVVCGHNGFCAQFYTPNETGRDVPQCLFNLQYKPFGGDGLIQQWEFPENTSRTIVRIIDTKNSLNYYESGVATTFVLDSLQRI